MEICQKKMKPLFVLLAVTAIAIVTLKISSGKINFIFAGKIGLAVMLIFTASGHFAFNRGMSMMFPDFVPYRKILVYISGVLEILAAVALFVPSTQKFAGWFLIIFFIVALPLNIYAAMMNVDYQNATHTGPGLNYLWFRIPFQLLLVIWTYYSVIKIN